MNRFTAFAVVVLLAGCRTGGSPPPSPEVAEKERVGRLIVEMQLPDPERAEAAQRELALCGEEAAVRLMGLAATGPPLVAVRALRVLGAVRSRETLVPICSILSSSPHESVRIAAADALASYASPLAIDPIAGAIAREPCADVRVASLRVLEATPDPAAGLRAFPSLMDPAEMVRAGALAVVVRHRPEGAGAALAAGYAALPPSGAWAEKERILALLVEWDEPHALALLEDALSNPFSSPTRSEAARLLGELGDPRAVSALIEAIIDARPEVALAAHDSLARLTGLEDEGQPAVGDEAARKGLRERWKKRIEERR